MSELVSGEVSAKYIFLDGLCSIGIGRLDLSPHHIERSLADQSINYLVSVSVKSEPGNTGGQQAENGHRGATELTIIITFGSDSLELSSVTYPGAVDMSFYEAKIC